MNSNLTITRSKGFHLTFENGYCISVQFGTGNYCQNKHEDRTFSENFYKERDCSSADAEIAVWAPGNKGVDGALEELDRYDQVVGWLSADEVARAISYVQKGQIKALKRMCRSRK